MEFFVDISIKFQVQKFLQWNFFLFSNCFKQCVHWLIWWILSTLVDAMFWNFQFHSIFKWKHFDCIFSMVRVWSYQQIDTNPKITSDFNCVESCKKIPLEYSLMRDEIMQPAFLPEQTQSLDFCAKTRGRAESSSVNRRQSFYQSVVSCDHLWALVKRQSWTTYKFKTAIQRNVSSFIH